MKNTNNAKPLLLVEQMDWICDRRSGDIDVTTMYGKLNTNWVGYFSQHTSVLFLSTADAVAKVAKDLIKNKKLGHKGPNRSIKYPSIETT